MWADTLDVIVELADVIVPGHGPVGGAAEIRDLQAYLRACVAANGDPNAVGSGPWDTWVDRAERDAINVERAALLAEGRDEMPASMLRAIGHALILSAGLWRRTRIPTWPSRTWPGGRGRSTTG